MDALAERKKIVKLVLSHNAVGQQSCTALAKLLQKSLVLEWLECHWGHMRKDGAEEFAEALVSADQLKHLDLGWNGFGDLVPCRSVHWVSANARFNVRSASAADRHLPILCQSLQANTPYTGPDLGLSLSRACGRQSQELPQTKSNFMLAVQRVEDCCVSLTLARCVVNWLKHSKARAARSNI